MRSVVVAQLVERSGVTGKIGGASPPHDFPLGHGEQVLRYLERLTVVAQFGSSEPLREIHNMMSLDDDCEYGRVSTVLYGFHIPPWSTGFDPPGCQKLGNGDSKVTFGAYRRRVTYRDTGRKHWRHTNSTGVG